MARTLCVLVAVLAFMAGTASAQDAKAVLTAASKAMGALESVQITGTGWNAAVGQSFGPGEDWPRFEVTRYTRTIDYDAGSSREELTRRQGNNPPRGGGGTPLKGEQQQVFVVSGNYAWNMQDGKPVPQPGLFLAGIPVAELRRLDIANMRSLNQNIQRLKLDVAQHVPLHGQPGPNDQFMQIVGKQSN